VIDADQIEATIMVTVMLMRRPLTKTVLTDVFLLQTLVATLQDMIRITIDARTLTGDMIRSFTRQLIRFCMSSSYF
jgi:hypothetical protein